MFENHTSIQDIQRQFCMPYMSFMVQSSYRYSLNKDLEYTFANSSTTSVVKLSSSIRIDDSLTDGKSYYFEEVNVMSSLIGETAPGHQNIFILDEVFKGTNTIERIAAGKAILSYLNKGNNMVFVSTHDIELSELLAKEYDLYHFTETITDNQLHFNYKLTPGPLKTRNAIKILEISGYPTEIVQEAQSISKSLSDAAIHNRYSGGIVENPE